MNLNELIDDDATYGEACDVITAISLVKIAKVEEKAGELRAIGENEKAEELESEAEKLSEAVLTLTEKRQQMPFGNLTEDQRETLRDIYGPIIPDDESSSD